MEIEQAISLSISGLFDKDLSDNSVFLFPLNSVSSPFPRVSSDSEDSSPETPEPKANAVEERWLHDSLARLGFVDLESEFRKAEEPENTNIIQTLKNQVKAEL